MWCSLHFQDPNIIALFITMASSRSLALSPSSGSGQMMPSTAKHPVVYQIDFTAVASGKVIAATKRRVRW